MALTVGALIISFPAAAEVCDKGEEIRIFGPVFFWSAAFVLACCTLFYRSRAAAYLLSFEFAVPLLLTLLEGNIDSDPFVRGMIAEGCKLPYHKGLQQGLFYAAFAPLLAALPFLADRLRPQKETHR